MVRVWSFKYIISTKVINNTPSSLIYEIRVPISIKERSYYWLTYKYL